MNNNDNQQSTTINQGGKRSIVAVHMEGSDIEQYKLDDGSILSEEQAIAMVRQGFIEGYLVAQRNDVSYIRGIPDGDPMNNLASLPKF